MAFKSKIKEKGVLKMLEHRLHKSIINTSIIYLFFLLLIFIASILVDNGNIVLIIFMISMFFIIMIFKDLGSALGFFIALLINNALIETQITMLDGTTITGLIKIFFLFLFLYVLKKNRIQKKIIIGYKFFFLWTCYLVFNSLINQVSTLSTLNDMAFFMIICIFMQVYLNENQKFKKYFISGLLTGLIFVTLCAYIELFLGRTFYYSLWTGAERYRYGILRTGSTVADPNFLALTEIFLICFINIPIIKKIIGKMLCTVLSFISILLIILTFSRTGILSLLVVFVFINLIKHKKFIILLVPLFLILSLPVIMVLLKTLTTLDASSALARNSVIDVALTLWNNDLFFGNGNNYFYNVSASYIGTQLSTMNEYVGQLVNFGLIGLAFYLLYFIIIFKVTISRFYNLFLNKNLIYYFSMMVMWLLMSYSLDTYSKVLIWLLPGIIICVTSVEKEVGVIE